MGIYKDYLEGDIKATVYCCLFSLIKGLLKVLNILKLIAGFPFCYA